MWDALRPRVWFLPAFFLVLAAWARDDLRVAFVLIGSACILWIFFYTWVSFYSTRAEAEAERMKQYRLLDEDGRAALGYVKAAGSLKVETTQPIQGPYKQTRYDLIPGSPAQLAAFFHGVLGGRSIRFREWTPRARGFSDTEFEKLTAKLIELKYLEKIGESNNATFELTDLGLLAFFNHCQESGRVDLDELDAAYYDRLAGMGKIQSHPDSELEV